MKSKQFLALHIVLSKGTIFIALTEVVYMRTRESKSEGKHGAN